MKTKTAAELLERLKEISKQLEAAAMLDIDFLLPNEAAALSIYIDELIQEQARTFKQLTRTFYQ